MATTNSRKIGSVEDYVRGYQLSLRALRDQMPRSSALPGPITAAIGRCEVWPCRDAAIVLTYADKYPTEDIEVMESVAMTVDEFMAQHDALRYYDSRGREVSFRLGIAPIGEDDRGYDARIPKGDFSTRKIETTDIIASVLTETLETVEVLRPAFTKLSIYGWNVILGNPQRAAVEEVRRTVVSYNILGKAASDSSGHQRMQRLIAATDQTVKELETHLDQGNATAIKSMLSNRPQLLHPGTLVSCSDVRLTSEVTPDFILLVQTVEGRECVVVKLEDVSSTYFDGLDHTTIKYGDVLPSLKEVFAKTRDSLPIALSEDSVVRFELVRGRSASLTYLQRTALRAQESELSFLTYDDLIEQIRYETYDVANIWDRFEPIAERLRKLGLANDEIFGQVMAQIDEQMRNEGTAITARSLHAPGKFTWAYRTWLMHGDPLHEKIVDWFNRRYGDRLKMDPTWKMAVQIRGDLYRIRLPLCFGTVKVTCSVAHLGITNKSPIGTQDQLPTINVLDLLDDFTDDYSRSLTNEELTGLISSFLLGFEARNKIDSISESEFVKEAIGDIYVSVSHLFATPPQYGLSKWSSLQAVEKLLKAFIHQQGGQVDRIHQLERLAERAESLGLPTVPRSWLDQIQCSAGVRYGEIDVTPVEAVHAHHAALAICSGIASYQFLNLHHTQATELEPGKFYTNTLDKYYRCVKVNGDKANIILFDEAFGKSLEIEFVQDRKFWGEYFLIEDARTIQKLEERYQALAATMPPEKASGTLAREAHPTRRCGFTMRRAATFGANLGLTASVL